MPCHAKLCHAKPCHAKLCYAMLCYDSSPLQVPLVVADGGVVLVQCDLHMTAAQVGQQVLAVGTMRDGPDQDPVTVHLREREGSRGQRGRLTFDLTHVLFRHFYSGYTCQVVMTEHGAMFRPGSHWRRNTANGRGINPASFQCPC